ncbi:glycosyltransferase [Desulfobacca acetoxidans]
MKILYFHGKRGKEKTILEYLNKQRKLNYEEIILINKFSLNIFTIIKNIIFVINKFLNYKPDIVLLETPNIFALPFLVLKSCSKFKIIVRIKGDVWQTFRELKYSMPLRDKIIKIVNHVAFKLFVKYADGFLPISQYLKQALEKKEKVLQPTKIVYIPRPIMELSILNDPIRESSEPIYHTISSKNFILTVTNFSFYGKIESLAIAVNNISPFLRKYQLEWIILGDGYFINDFKEKIRDSLNNGSVKMLGWQNPFPYYRNGRIFVYISNIEGLPNVLLEAFYFKIPVVINHDFPIAEIRNSPGVILWDIHDTSKAVTLLNKIKTDYSFFENSVKKSFEFVEREFSLENVSAQMENALASIR